MQKMEGALVQLEVQIVTKTTPKTADNEYLRLLKDKCDKKLLVKGLNANQPRTNLPGLNNTHKQGYTPNKRHFDNIFVRLLVICAL